MYKKVLVFGFYFHANHGDQLFIEAFQYLFPDYDFIFTDHIDTHQLSNIDVVFFGGGSFLLDRPNISEQAIYLLSQKQIFYLGVGVEEDIHPIHVDLMMQAKLIATRSINQVDRLMALNKQVRFIPDLVYALQSKVVSVVRESKSVLIMPNIYVVSRQSDPHWKHASWNYFKSELVQFLDWLVENNYHPSLFSMCKDRKADDSWAGAELISAMDKRSQACISLAQPKNFSELSKLVSAHSLLITQRFHGIILAEMTQTPYLAIHHHDKLLPSNATEGTFLSYYNCSKHLLIEAFEKTRVMHFKLPPIPPTTFESFKEEVISLIK